MISLIVANLRFIGPAAFLAIGGIISISLSERKSFVQWYFLISLIFMIPFIYDLTYGMYLLLLYSIIFLSVGFRSSIYNSAGSNRQAVKIIAIFIVSIIVISTFFTGFYNHNRTGEYQYLWHMSEQSYEFGNWVNDRIDKDSRIFMVAENNYINHVVALQEDGLSILIGGTQGRAYGFINDSYTEYLEKVPATSSYFYSEGVYLTEERDIYRSMAWYIESRNIQGIKDVYSLDYLIQSRTYFKRVQGLNSNTAEIIYTNGVHDVYELRHI
jgi:hypothetical protein